MRAARLLELCGQRVHLGGNIGRALISSLDDMHADDIAVVEVSSYQLEALPAQFGPCARVAAVACVNVLADHLERHGTIEGYEAAKKRLLDLAGESATVVLCADDPRVSRWRPVRGRELRYSTAANARTPLRIEAGNFVREREDGTLETLGAVADVQLPGEFQRGNVLAALGLARALGASPAALAAALPHVRGLEHRLQDLGLFDGHRGLGQRHLDHAGLDGFGARNARRPPRVAVRRPSEAGFAVDGARAGCGATLSARRDVRRLLRRARGCAAGGRRRGARGA
jgi:UDP-N-acetylmuramoylalanine--D-glutamate ligase